MPVTAVVGAQWGDEGKGKIVDYLAGSADMVIRFQGGPNAGHTVINDLGEFKLHGIPSGIFRGEVDNIIGPGCVVSPPELISELANLNRYDVHPTRFFISDRAHVIMPYHLEWEAAEETSLGHQKIGTTRKAVGPAYADKYGRWGVRMGDLAHSQWLRMRLTSILNFKNPLFKALNIPEFEPETIFQQCRDWQEKLGRYTCDTLPIVHNALAANKNILLEGQLGAGKGVEFGCYPFVTSSSPTASYASSGAGIPSHRIDRVIGVVKAYSTSVGAGPMVTQDETDEGPKLREIGHEYGATTGRPRSCGWLDALMLKHAAQVNGFTDTAITRLDVLDHFERIGICIAYQHGKDRLYDMPITPVQIECQPVVEYMDGWNCSTRAARKLSDLPKQAREYVDKISEYTAVPALFVSVGPERESTIVIDR